MIRIRIVFVLLAVVMFVPLGLLVQNALESVRVERDRRHRAVADRIFNEIERELGRIVSREEARAFGHYRFFYVPVADRRGKFAIARSPLSHLPEDTFVLGFFQVDPDQTFHSPLMPRGPALKRAFAEWDYSIEIERAVRRVERVASIGLRADVAGKLRRRNAIFAKEPGTTHALHGAFEVLVEEGDTPADEAGADEARLARRLGAFEALRSLNRSGRRGRIAVRVSRRSPEGGVEPAGSLRSVQIGRHRDGLDALPIAQIAESLIASLEDEVRLDRYFDVDAAIRDETPPLELVALYPMEGRTVGSDHLILYRDAIFSGQRFRQGVVLDVRALADWLIQTVLGGSELGGRVTPDFFIDFPSERRVAAAYVYMHRFSEPFGDLALRLILPPLQSAEGTTYLYTIAGLLVLAGSVGLFALYHMVGVTVRYAERRSNFAAAVSHELKTPLTAIRMHSEMLRDGMVPDDEKRSDYYATITAESERLTRLIDNVLEFSRLEQGTREMNIVTAPIGSVVRDVARNLEGHVASAGFRLDIEIDDDLPPVRFERDAVVQILYNLVDNALKYARDAQEKVVHLRCARAGETVRLTVRDAGPGVAAKHLRKVFEPFYRAGSELTRTAKGTGIGLALVKGLAGRMGAAVSGKNASGGGFEVSLTFRAVA